MLKIFGGVIAGAVISYGAFSYTEQSTTTEEVTVNKALQTAEAAGLMDPLEAKLDQIFMDAYPADRPGASVLVSKGDKIILKKGYGLADAEHGMAIEPHMTFRLGSLTKQFTAVAILMLEQEGLLKVTDNINVHLPDYPTYGEVITIEQLLSHRSGIFNYTNIPGFFENSIHSDMSMDELIGVFKDFPLDFKPGSKWNYSNSGFVLLGAIIEKLSTQTYAEFVNERIFTPLEMRSSHYGSNINIIPNRARGYRLTEDGFTNAPYIAMSIPHAAGSLLSNTGDMLKWHKALLSGNVLPRDVLEKAWTTTTLTDGEETGYGYGWGVDPAFDVKVIRHSGGIPGFSTYGLSIIDDDIYVIVLSNLPGAANLGSLVDQATTELMAD
ncbi:MAG: beta-lactamase family protein [Kordiimonadaceae bacterium]|jgi:D-alanyl-D-alanine carboxypeptidase|nr:beta-lactamase family protein [Kordiimonadaceae bacterium]MBT6035806.1 beta-lactamase family protein [Kordiimonadaceae bacterium]MBT6330216.1 beta-lactamase family protein [Kordiimonadaceae bacterium]MBT7582055.1 beta-lactamase family protein [Kordiimonadaceae bacterium]